MMDHAVCPPALGPRELYARLAGWVRRALARLGVAASDVEDLTQDVFVTLHRRGVAFDDERSARAWLHATARRVASNYRRAQHRRERRIEHAPVPSVATDPEAIVAQRRAITALDRLAAELSPDARDVLRMSADGLTAPAIATRLGIPLNTTYSHLRRARSRLRTLALFVLALVAFALSLLSVQCGSEAADDRARVAIRGDSQPDVGSAAPRS